MLRNAVDVVSNMSDENGCSSAHHGLCRFGKMKTLSSNWRRMFQTTHRFFFQDLVRSSSSSEALLDFIVAVQTIFEIKTRTVQSMFYIYIYTFLMI